MWLIFGAFFGLTGAGLMWKNTLGSIATAFGMEDKIGGFVLSLYIYIYIYILYSLII